MNTDEKNRLSVLRLDAALSKAGVPIYGVDMFGFVSFKPEATEQHRALAAQIVAAHDPAPTYAEMRAKEYPTTDALIVALWERLIENRPEASVALQAQRLAVKAKYPKPT